MAWSKSASLLVCSFAVLAVACREGEDEGWPASACEDVETVASSWMNWKAAVGEFGHHYRYTRQSISFMPEPPDYCLYITTVEVEGDAILARELSVESGGAATCEATWIETGEQIGSHDDAWAAPATTIETIYEDCCVMVMPGPDYYYTDNHVGEYALYSYCGDDYCDDGGCSYGPLPDVRVHSIEFLD
jgi:hypothetical protein